MRDARFGIGDLPRHFHLDLAFGAVPTQQARLLVWAIKKHGSTRGGAAVLSSLGFAKAHDAAYWGAAIASANSGVLRAVSKHQQGKACDQCADGGDLGNVDALFLVGFDLDRPDIDDSFCLCVGKIRHGKSGNAAADQ